MSKAGMIQRTANRQKLLVDVMPNEKNILNVTFGKQLSNFNFCWQV